MVPQFELSTAREGSDPVNIGATERRVRLVMGVLFLVAGVAMAYLMGARDVTWGWRLLLFPVFYQGVRFLYDHQTGTCPLKAELGQRKLHGWMTILGDAVDDPELVVRIRDVSRRALVRSVGLAAVFTVITLFL